MTDISTSMTRSSSTWGIRYPSPFFDVALQYMPDSVRKRQRWCEYYINNEPLIYTSVRRMSEYPITDIEIEGKKDSIITAAEIMFERLKIKALCVQIGLHYFGFGDCFISIHQKFNRRIVCHSCHKYIDMEKKLPKNFSLTPKTDKTRVLWSIKGCPHCGNAGPCSILDHYVKPGDNANVYTIRWDPKQIDIDYNPFSGMSTIYYIIPKLLRSKILKGDLFIMRTTPKIFLEGAVMNKKIILQKENLFHFSRASNAGESMGWGEPLIQPVLKELYQIQIAKKAREAVMQQHIVPLWIIFPSGAGEGDPFKSMNLGVWRSRIEGEFKKWRRDPNYIPLMPMPLGFQYIGGDMKKLDPTGIIEFQQKEVIAGMGVPVEFIFGGTGAYSQGSVSLRMLENQFINFRYLLTDFLNSFLIPKLVKFAKVNAFTARFTKLRMMDDIQQKQLTLNMNMAGKVSDKSTLPEMGDFDYDNEQLALDRQFEREDRRMADRMRRQMATQKEMGMSQQNADLEQQGEMSDRAGMDMSQMIDSHADTLATMDPEGRSKVMQGMSTSMPEYSNAVTEAMNTKNVNMKPPPEQKPPRSENKSK